MTAGRLKSFQNALASCAAWARRVSGASPAGCSIRAASTPGAPSATSVTRSARASGRRPSRVQKKRNEIIARQEQMFNEADGRTFSGGELEVAQKSKLTRYSDPRG